MKNVSEEIENYESLGVALDKSLSIALTMCKYCNKE